MEWYSFRYCKKRVNYMSIPFTRMINKCFDEGYFPTQLKFCWSLTVFKKGDKEGLSNYRPIFTLPLFS